MSEAMNLLKLKVTSKVLNHVHSVADINQQQIAFLAISGDLREQASTIRKDRRYSVIIADQIHLILGDTSAIWRSHQDNTDGFDLLFQLLSFNTNKEHSFTYQLLSESV